MAFSNEKLKPCDALVSSIPAMFTSIRSSCKRKSNRLRQCYRCMGMIQPTEKYINHQFRYDRRIVTASFHSSCFLIDKAGLATKLIPLFKD